MEVAQPSAVAIIETPDSYVMEGRPDLPGKLAHAGKLQFFGGHCEEHPRETITRELAEELDLHLPHEPELLWVGEVDSQNRAGEAVRRHVSLFHVAIDSVAELNLKVSGEIVEIPKNEEVIVGFQQRMTPFAFNTLVKAARGEFNR